MSNRRARLVIGLDFGTTFSGVAYSDRVGEQGSVSDIHLVQGWPGVNMVSNNEKVPSRIAYLPPNRAHPGGEILWGNKIKHTTKAPVHACMKLKLDDTEGSSRELRGLMAMLASRIGDMGMDDPDDIFAAEEDEGLPPYPGKTTVEIVGDYLAQVREVAFAEISKRYGRAMFSSMRRDLVVTVPAVWSERAKDLTLQAVAKAEWDAAKVSLVTEPEAAAIYTLLHMREGPSKEEVQVGDIFVLCDAGGGTVDLISYKITQVSPTFLIEEAAVGSGDKCGATFVDQEFLGWLEQWIGSERFKNIPPEKRRHGSPMMNSFEVNKLQFSGDDDEMSIALPSETGLRDDEDLQIEDGSVSLTNAQMKQLFNPCVTRAVELIDGQLVLVVGGFGRNQYLYRKIDEYCQGRGIQTRRPGFPWSAVARGAVCRGLEGAEGGPVSVRLSRKFYGTPLSIPFIPGVHRSQDAYTDRFTGDRMARGQMNWMVKKAERLPENNPKVISIGVHRHFGYSDARKLDAFLCGCTEDVAPTRRAHDDIQIVCRVTADFSDIPVSYFPRMKNKKTGKEYFEVDFELEARFQGGELTWRLMWEDKEWGSTTVSYDE
ncbi:hypothetical protein C8A05DRAFT_46227 [Staphylotrichum tortipilum]|uniref:Uncharacterized protein n=1 Tax=Staphylotrichum tortipilum TaxID=2831512 RepID=A0AAN6MFW7_9PEZI|nr:hypothetical protein C8A05DRAFT_46227 [Staphylotrichum longicolle]